MISIAVCDDRPDQLALIQQALQRFFEKNSMWTADVKSFASPMLLLEHMEQNGGFDVALLDVCMPEMLGTGVAREIRARCDVTEIIFMTTSSEYAVDAFALKAAHYLLKPFTQDDFEEAMNRALSRMEEAAPKTLSVKSEGGSVRLVNIREITYIESQGHLLHVYTETGFCTEEQRSLTRFSEELEKLSPGQFISPYKGYIVNLRAIRSIEAERMLLRSGAVVPIPKRRFRELQNIYFDFIFPSRQFKEDAK